MKRPDCNCPAANSDVLEHYTTCPVHEPPLTDDEKRALRALLAAPATQATLLASDL